MSSVQKAVMMVAACCNLYSAKVQGSESRGGQRGEWESGERVQHPDSLVYEAVCESGGAGTEAPIPSP